MDIIPNVALPLVIEASVENHTIYNILVDDERSCNILYIKMLMKLGLPTRSGSVR